MKTPIEARDILKGDVIRVEQSAKQAFYAHAFEYVAQFDGNGCGVVDHYLLDRPTPHVELPTEPTLGWAEWQGSEGAQRELDFFALDEYSDGIWCCDREWGVGREHITAFTPAVAVPASALDELRGGIGLYTSPETLIDNFLAAVDAANGDAS